MSKSKMQLITGRQVLRGIAADGSAEIIDDGAVLVREGRIAAVGNADELKAENLEAEVTGSPADLLAPGFINAHHHVGLTPFQLGAADLPLELWFAVTMGQRSRDPYLDTLYSAFEMISSGITTVQHLHIGRAGPAVIAEQAAAILRAYKEIGMRVSYSYAYRDQNRFAYESDETFVARLPTDLADWVRPWLAGQHFAIEDYLGFVEALDQEHHNDHSVAVQLAPAGFHWCSDEALSAIGALSRSRSMPIHMHLLETPYQAEYGRRRGEGGAVSHLERLGLLGPQLTLGHGVWLTEEDADLIAQSGTCICHNASSNMRLASGRAPCKHLVARGIKVGIGIDEAGLNDDRDMLQEMRLVSHLHKDPGMHGAGLQPGQVFRMATEDGAMTTPFAGRIGRLDVGMAADIVVHDWSRIASPYLDPTVDAVSALIQRGRPGSVRSVMIAGAWVYRDRTFLGVNQKAAMMEIAAMMAMPASAADQERRRRGLELLPHLKELYGGDHWGVVTNRLRVESERRAWADTFQAMPAMEGGAK